MPLLIFLIRRNLLQNRSIKKGGGNLRKTVTIQVPHEGELKNISLKQKEIFLIQNMCITGANTKTFLLEHIGEKRIRNLCNLGIFEKIPKPHRTEDEEGKIVNRYYFTLGEQGKKFALEEGYCNKLQGANGYVHAEKMERVVNDLLVNKGISIKNIYNEKDQKSVFKKELRELRNSKTKYHINDIAYKDENGNWNSIEIVTSNYGKKLLKKHEAYANAIGASYIKI